jgi:hypothetical protein
MRHIIYARAKTDIEISVPDENYCAYQKVRRPSYAPIRKIGAQNSASAYYLGFGRISNC